VKLDPTKYEELVTLLLQSPDTHLDAKVLPYIQKWSTPPTALQVLEVLDLCIFGSLASGFTTRLLQSLYDQRCREENTSHEVLAKLASWRESV
jgi:hypothetical protein